MSEEYLRQMRELERQEKGFTSQYDNNEKLLDPNDFKTVVNADLDESPKTGQTWAQYSDLLRVHIKIHQKKNFKTHVDGPRKAWYTHRSPMGCFMCEDINLIALLGRVIGLMAIQHPDNRF